MRLKARHAFLSVEKYLRKHPIVTTCGMVLLCALLIISRKYHDFRHPQFWAEDGVVWFAQAYNSGFWHTILRPYSGTFSILTRIVGSIATLLPIRYVPLFFNLSALACQLLPVILITSSRLKYVTKYRSIAIIVSLLYVMIPNSREVFLNLANVQWHLGIASFLVLIADRPKNRGWKLFDVAVLFVTGMTGPVGIALVPVAVLMYYYDRSNHKLHNLLALLLTMFLQLLSLFIIEPGQRSGHQTTATFLKAIEMFTGQIITGGIFGQNKVDWLYGNKFLLYLAFTATIGFLIYIFRYAPSWLKYANLFSITIFLVTLVSQKPLKGYDIWLSLTQPGVGQRYWYIPIFVWIVTLVWIVCTKTLKPLRALSAVLLICLVFFGIPNSWFLQTYQDLHYQYYVRQFNQSRPGQSTVFPINPVGWGFTITKQ